MANEWARLQTERLIDFDNLCMWVLFFIAGVPASGAPYYNANCNTPDGAFLDDCTDWARSDLLRISVDAFFWIVVGLWQVVASGRSIFHSSACCPENLNRRVRVARLGSPS